MKESHLGRDSLVATSIILNLLANEGKPLSEICNYFPKYYIHKTSIKIKSFRSSLFDLIKENFKNEKILEIDGLKIEPLPKALTGNENNLPQPIQNVSDLYEALDERIMAGFGGVAEYGVTVRWDKNFLK